VTNCTCTPTTPELEREVAAISNAIANAKRIHLEQKALPKTALPQTVEILSFDC
jgi:hypothetical protein